MYPPPPPGTVVVTTVARPRGYYVGGGGGGGYSPQASRAMRAFAVFFFVAVVLSFALSFGLRTNNSSSSSNVLYFVLPGVLFFLVVVLFAVRMAALRAAARRQAEGTTAVVGAAWVPTATPVGYLPGGTQPVPGYPVAYPVVNTYPGAPSYASSLALPPPPGSGAYPQQALSPTQAQAPQAQAGAPCAVCLVAPRTTALGCGHVFCDRCAAQLTSCALCRAPVASRIRLYG
jgi:hypothetical protein